MSRVKHKYADVPKAGAKVGNDHARKFEGQNQTEQVGFRTLAFYKTKWQIRANAEKKTLTDWITDTLNANL